jgi:MerR family transcriptional regulator, light-induced transcriptional regulator
MDRPSAGQPEPTMPVAAVARRIGVAPSTLRTWDRRYGLGPSKHIDGHHRRYGVSDIGRLELMQRALLRGASTAEAARFALEQIPKSGPSVELPVARARPREEETAPAENPDRAAARRLRSAALAMDAGEIQRILDEVIASAGVLSAWEGVIKPVLAAFGAGWHGLRAGAEVEYLLSECVLAALLRATPVVHSPRNLRPVLLGCVPGGRTRLPLYAMSACLAKRGIATQPFGTPLPPEVLTSAVLRSAPAAVVLWAQRGTPAEACLFPRVSRGRLRCRMFAWGPGWHGVPLPVKIELLRELRVAVDRIEFVLLGQ